jgi:folate-binding protein YgfZ
MYAAALTPKGKIIADLRVFVQEDSILVDCPAPAWEGWWSTVRKYVNPRACRYTDVRETLHDLGVFGALARHTVAELTGASAVVLGTLEPYAQLRVEVGGSPVVIARVPDLTIEGFELFADPAVIAMIAASARDGDIVTASSEAWEIARVESGRPAWGIDMDDNTIPQEANFDDLDAISYTKGCYTGQEIVARVHFRGHVNRRLVGLRGSTAEPPAGGAVLFDESGKEVGDVRSAVSSPRLGGIGLAMVRREISEGSALVARYGEQEQSLQVIALPFPL